MSRKEKCRICGGTGEVLITDWLTRGMTKEEIAKEKEEALADIVQVVRCKDCVKSRSVDKTRVPEKYFRDDCFVCECEEVVGDEPMIYPPNHFCSYGERK